MSLEFQLDLNGGWKLCPCLRYEPFSICTFRQIVTLFWIVLGAIQAVAPITSRISNAAWPHSDFNGKPKVCSWIGFDFCQVGVSSIRIPSVETGLWRIWWKNFLFWTNAVILRFLAKFPKGDFVHDEPNHANGSQGNWKGI